MRRVRPLVIALALLACARASGAERPNFVVILADDMGWGDASCYGQTRWTTPRIDEMAAQGMRFTDAYAGTSVCAPSRATLLTGKHTGHVFVRGNGVVQFPPDPDERTIASYLQDLGYETAMIGKSGVACHSTDAALPNAKGFDHFFGYLSHRAAHRHYPETLCRDGEWVTIEGNKGDKGYTGQRYADELFVADALDWIGQEREAPFFLHLSLTAPHADMTVPDRYREPFRGRFEEKPWGAGGYFRQPEGLATYAGMIAFVDETVGRVLDRLRELGIDERTVVVFASDNGPSPDEGPGMRHFDSNGPFRGGKRDLYEGGIRTPQIVWWPGTIGGGAVSAVPTAFWDLAPTMLDLAGAPIPDSMDGVSIAPTLVGETQDLSGRALYWEFHERGGKQAVRLGRWKAVRLNVGRDRAGAIELYDLETDPGETADVVAANPDVAAALVELMASMRTESDLFLFGIGEVGGP